MENKPTDLPGKAIRLVAADWVIQPMKSSRVSPTVFLLILLTAVCIQSVVKAEVQLSRGISDAYCYAYGGSPRGEEDPKRGSVPGPVSSDAHQVGTYGSPHSTATASSTGQTALIFAADGVTAEGFTWSFTTATSLNQPLGGGIPAAIARLDATCEIAVISQAETVTIDVTGWNYADSLGGGGLGLSISLVNAANQFVGGGPVANAGNQFGPYSLSPGTYTLKLSQFAIANVGGTGGKSLGTGGAVHFTNFSTVPGSSQTNPIIGEPTLPPLAPGWSFRLGPPRRFYDPPLAQGYTFTATGTALFKEISAFPSGIPAEYYVTTEGATYGPFAPQQFMSFETLHGHAVSSFVVKGIKPFVDATAPVAFPIMLDFTEELADFTMIPIAAPDIQMETLPNGDLKFTFDGVLQSSPDLNTWTDVTPTPTSPHVIPKALIGGAKFFRSSKP